MRDEARVLEELSGALGAVWDRLPATGLALRTVRRPRATLYFIGCPGERTPRWVVKHPEPACRQQDLGSPPHALAQLEALVVLHDHLRTTSARITAPRPVALLPGVEALAREYVAGQTLSDLMSPDRVVGPEPVSLGVRRAAEALLVVHRVAPGITGAVDLTATLRRAGEQVRRHLGSAGLPCRDNWLLLHEPRCNFVEPREVALHGDWVPENVVLSGEQVACLDPELIRRGWPERDVSRFLALLFEAPLFVTEVEGHAATRLRRRATVSFLRAYYGDRGVSQLLQPLLMADLAARWAMRDHDVVRRNPPGALGRRMLLRRHFDAVLDEVSVPGWPRTLDVEVRPAIAG